MNSVLRRCPTRCSEYTSSITTLAPSRAIPGHLRTAFADLGSSPPLLLHSLYPPSFPRLPPFAAPMKVVSPVTWVRRAMACTYPAPGSLRSAAARLTFLTLQRSPGHRRRLDGFLSLRVCPRPLRILLAHDPNLPSPFPATTRVSCPASSRPLSSSALSRHATRPCRARTRVRSPASLEQVVV